MGLDPACGWAFRRYPATARPYHTPGTAASPHPHRVPLRHAPAHATAHRTHTAAPWRARRRPSVPPCRAQAVGLEGPAGRREASGNWGLAPERPRAGRLDEESDPQRRGGGVWCRVRRRASREPTTGAGASEEALLSGRLSPSSRPGWPQAAAAPSPNARRAKGAQRAVPRWQAILKAAGCRGSEGLSTYCRTLFESGGDLVLASGPILIP